MKTRAAAHLVLPLLAALATGSFGCAYLHTPKVLDLLNAPSSSADAAARPTVAARVGRLVREHLADVYFVPASTGAWMTALGAAPDPILAQLACLRGKRGQDASACYDAFRDAVLVPATTSAPGAAPAWGVAAPPALTFTTTTIADPQTCADVGVVLADPSGSGRSFACRETTAPVFAPASDGSFSATATLEIDAERFAANAIGVASSLIALEDSLGRPLDEAKELRPGIASGANEASAYVRSPSRPARSAARPRTSLVMSGGAANGAFTGGFVWRLLETLRRCRAGEVSGCNDAAIDLVVGTSTGSLVGVLVDLFHTKGQEANAMRLLVDNYTCVDESKLYCVNSTLDWKLAQDVRGIIRFDGIRGLLKSTISNVNPSGNATELVTMTVDYDSGDAYAISDLDPVDAADTEGRVDALLSSIVEPILSEPVDSIGRKNAPAYRGTFIDGGIRTGLPVLEAMHRGAERMIAISTSGIEADPIAHPTAATQILFRTIDLLVEQPRVGELQQAELAAVARRMQEYTLCERRLGAVTNKAARDRFCRRDNLFPSPSIQSTAPVSLWLGPTAFQEVARSWQTEWIYRPEEVPKAPSATGYSFDPDLMRTIWKQGMAVFQTRCSETLHVIGLPQAVIDGECTAARAASLAQHFDAAFKAKPSSQCKSGGPKYRICE